MAEGDHGAAAARQAKRTAELKTGGGKESAKTAKKSDEPRRTTYDDAYDLIVAERITDGDALRLRAQQFKTNGDGRISKYLHKEVDADESQRRSRSPHAWHPFACGTAPGPRFVAYVWEQETIAKKIDRKGKPRAQILTEAQAPHRERLREGRRHGQARVVSGKT